MDSGQRGIKEFREGHLETQLSLLLWSAVAMTPWSDMKFARSLELAILRQKILVVTGKLREQERIFKENLLRIAERRSEIREAVDEAMAEYSLLDSAAKDLELKMARRGLFLDSRLCIQHVDGADEPDSSQ
ncbi:unnamed protein product [Nippostrongylus brasiliensis]|uniref:Uncharacterized protein n=1 Tax=Nippostrongylus brasiliensis TaxID=27835 RepID=A0A0N4YMR3_NIPBR|nr:unnamed protein product [Nippostrongylus brasiliensis]